MNKKLNKTEQIILKKLKEAKGNILGIGLDKEEYIEALENNEQIKICNLLNSYDGPLTYENKGRQKKIHIKNLRKKFKKKRVDELFCNYQEIIPYQNTFIPDSIYINKTKIYLFGSTNSKKEKENIEKILKKYNRYKIKIEKNEENKSALYIIDTSKTKTNRIVNLIYYIIDTISDTIEYILNLLSL